VESEFQDERRAFEGRTGLVGQSAAVAAIHEQIRIFAAADLNATIIGETGVGKERVARSIHALSRRAAGPFISINCANLEPGLMDSQLFGHVAGAFTDAKKSTSGLLLEAQGGIAFLDEVTELHPSCQAKLLRVFQEKELRPVGGLSSAHLDIRVISATNQNLRQAVRAGRFREDLYHRLAVGTISVPPLSDRLSDLPELVQDILSGLAGAGRRHEISLHAVAKLLSHRWTGNVRELENVLELATAYAGPDRIEARHIRLAEDEEERVKRSSLAAVVRSVERAHIVAMLDAMHWRKAEAAALLGIARTTLNRKIEEYGIEKEGLRSVGSFRRKSRQLRPCGPMEETKDEEIDP
jgi:DNA-binding NtrC family response regulator